MGYGDVFAVTFQCALEYELLGGVEVMLLSPSTAVVKLREVCMVRNRFLRGGFGGFWCDRACGAFHRYEVRGNKSMQGCLAS